MQGPRAAPIPQLLILLTLAACAWGALAYTRLKVELLPASQERLIVVLLEAPGHSADTVADRVSRGVLPAFRRHGFDCDIQERYVAHGGMLTCRTAEKPSHAERAARLRESLGAMMNAAGLDGSRLSVRDEPLQDRAFLRIGLPLPVDSASAKRLVGDLRGVEGVSDVEWQGEPAAWTNQGSFGVLTLKRREHASPVDVSAAARTRLPSHARIFYDEADYMRASESNLTENIVSGTFLTLLCVLLFLRRISSTLLVGVAIPLCVLLSIPFLYALGVTRNIMSLAGLALSVGIVVDASLSIVGDFDERMDSGRYLPVQAALRTLADAFTPLLVATLSTLAVFVPILFLSGRVGELFSELSKAVIVSNIVGLLVSIVVIPAVLALFPARPLAVPNAGLATSQEEQGQRGGIRSRLESLAGWSRRAWEATFYQCVATPARAALFLCASFVAVALVFLATPPQEFLPLPRDGRGLVEVDSFPWSIERPSAATKERDARILLALLPDAVVQEMGGRLLATFEADTSALANLRERLGPKFPGRPLSVALENPLRPLTAQSADVTFFLDGNRDALGRLSTWLHALPGVDTARVSALEGGPVNVQHFDLAPELAVSAPKETMRRYLDPKKDAPFALAGPYRIERRENVVVRVNGEPHTEGGVKLAPGLTTLAFEDALATFASQNGLKMHESVESREAKESLSGLGRCLLLAIGIIFLILFAQNRSASKSLIILATFAWAPLGAIPALAWHGETLNGSALVGFILLAGTIVNNGILLMDRVEKNIQQQMPVFESALEAVRDRSLNVVVTGLTTVLAMIPMIWGGQEGAQMYRSLSIVVVYGTIASTPVSFLGIPALLILRQGLVEWSARWSLRRRVALLSRRLAA